MAVVRILRLLGYSLSDLFQSQQATARRSGLRFGRNISKKRAVQLFEATSTQLEGIMNDMNNQGQSNKIMTFFICFLAALAGLLFGLDIGVIADALPFIAKDFQITASTQEW